FFFSSRRRHTRSTRDWSSDVCSSDLGPKLGRRGPPLGRVTPLPVAGFAVSRSHPQQHPDHSVFDSLSEAGAALPPRLLAAFGSQDRKSTRLNSSHEWISYAVFCLKKK